MPTLLSKPKVLIIDDEVSICNLLRDTLDCDSYGVAHTCDGRDALSRIRSEDYDVVLTDLKMPQTSGLDILRAVKEHSPATKVIVMTGFGTAEEREQAIELGAGDFISKSLQFFEIGDIIDRLVSGISMPASHLDEKADKYSRPIVGESESTRQLLKMISQIGPTPSSVLITGETGTGKELVARALHEASRRRNQPFVALNCAALAPGVLESELFGHEKGAFSGAVNRRSGRFEMANGGTLFLDEIGEIDTGVQSKLLRTLQEGEFERVGGMQTIKVDVRIIAATNKDLRSAIGDNQFREDLYYRLNVFSIHLAPLRDRREDIPVLASYFLDRICQRLEKRVRHISGSVMECFIDYPWPGNVRELENTLERAVVLAEEDTIRLGDLPPEFSPSAPPLGTFAALASRVPAPQSLATQTSDLERRVILETLERCRWNKTKTAETLGMKRTTLQYKIRKHSLD